MRCDTYKTKQKDTLLETIKKYKHEFTVKDLYNDLNKEVGLTTIYRFVEKLEHTGNLTKSIGNDNTTYYQYLENCNHENHFFLKCEKCGVIDHIDCDCITELTNHILNNHKFVPKKDHIIIDGICEKCNKEGK
jgi:Fur family ferric uptake transcriptional regulator